MENTNETDNKEAPNRTANYVASAIANFVVLIVLHLIPNWGIVFITDSYTHILWAVNLSLGIQIAGNIILLLYHPLHLHHLFNAVFSFAAVFSTAVILTVFPFDFSMVPGSWLTTLVRAVLIGATAASGISVIVNVVQALARFRR